MGLIARLVSAIHDTRHPSYIDHSLTDLLRQRIYQTASGYADGNDANTLRCDPMFKLAVGRAPLSEGNDLASGPTLSRLGGCGLVHGMGRSGGRQPRGRSRSRPV